MWGKMLEKVKEEEFVITHKDLTTNSSITLNCNTEPILIIKANGTIIWNSPNGEIIIEDKAMLGLAFMGTITSLTNNEYDYRLLDQDLYEQYKLFLNSKETK